MSGGVFLIQLYELNSTSWNIADRQISPNEFGEIATFVLSFLAVSHLVSWIADYIAYRKWFQSNQVQADSMEAIGSFKGNSESMISGVKVRVERLNSELGVLHEIAANKEKEGAIEQASNNTQKINVVRQSVNEMSKKLSNLEEDLRELSSRLDDIAPGFRAVSWVSGFVIYGWYLAIPMSVYLAAICLLWK